MKGASPDRPPAYIVSDDHRWVRTQSGNEAYLLDRTRGTQYRWDDRSLRLVTASTDLLLVQGAKDGAGDGRFAILNDSLKPVSSFALPLQADATAQAVFAPDGKTVAVRPSFDPPPKARLYVVEVATGKVKELGAPPKLTTGTVGSVGFATPAAPADLVASYVVMLPENSGILRTETIVRRFSWQGDLTAEFTVPGYAGNLSPDGRLIISGLELDQLATAAAAHDLTTGKPSWRVMGAHGADWLAGGGLLITDYQGAAWLMSPAGELKPGPTAPPLHGYFTYPGLHPAPHDPQLFATGAAVFDAAGKLRQAARLTAENWLIGGTAWSSSGKELRFTVNPPTGKDFGDGYGLPLPPKVQRPPLADQYVLQVQAPAGDCLNLRASYSTGSKVIRCLPGGTKLAAADLSLAPVKLNQAWWSEDNQLWLWVHTEQGENGWVAMSTGRITWAD